MGENENQGGSGLGGFDGIIKKWPDDSTLKMTNIPKNHDDFMLYMTCELFKNQYLSAPKEQAEACISYAHALMNALSAKGYL